MRRIIFLIAIFLLTLSPLIGQNPPITLSADGNWPTIVGDSIMLIGPKQEALTEEQRYFNPPYLLVYPGKEHLKEQMIRAALCDCDPTQPNRRIGVFSVAPDKQVSFSQGNLQYLPALNLWKFADEQYEYLGNANKYLSPTFRNWVDLFGWSADNTTAPFGVSTSTNAADYAGTFVDWGTNTICGDAPGTWRTMSVDEWEYIYHGRANAEKLFAMGTIEGNEGLILLPDDWILPQGAHFVASTDKGLQWKADRVEGSYVDENTSYSHFNDNIYTAAEWRVMEDAGAVFLPMANYRVGKEMKSKVTDSAPADGVGTYMTSPSASQEKNLYFMRFHYRELRKYPYTASSTLVIRGRSVRLVRDTIVPKVEPEYVDLGLSVKWATFNVGATSPEEYGDYFAWGETEPKDEYSWKKYKWSKGTENNITITKYNSTDSKHVLEPGDDAAHVHWGGKWRMPTVEEQTELREQCIWTWTSINGIWGHLVTGPNGKSIFLPAAGNITNTDLSYANVVGYQWSSSVKPGICAHRMHFSKNIIEDYDGGSRACGASIRPVYDDRPPKRIGVFSVAADKQVSFSQGNLQYVQSTDTWQFAREQYELIGEDYTTLGIWDLFGWSGKDNNAPFGVSESANVVDYRGEFVDWGKNRIGNDAPATWRTLSRDEWQYLIEIRPKADELYGVAMVAGVQGMILLPDDWVCPEGIIFNHGCHAKDNVENFAKHQTFSQEQWSIMEEAGAIFLPAAGIIYPPSKTITSVAGGAHYYSSDQKDADNAIFFGFRSSYYTINSSANRIRRSVRLVHDTIVPETIPDPCLVVKVNDTLSINMMCVEGGTFTMGQGENAHLVSLSSYSIGQTEVTQALWETVMGTNPSANTANKQLPVTNISWYDCQEFINRLNQLTGLRFRLPTEAEWEYAARGGQKSKGYTYAGSNDLKEVAWYNGNSGNRLHAVAQKKPNELGIYDMSGNAWEWCHDWHAPYPTTHQYNPLGPEVGQVVGKRYLRVFRGGSYGYEAAYHQNTFRDITGPEPNIGTANLGLRLVLSDDVNFETIHVNDTLSFHIMDVKGGTFMMGAMESDTQANANEKPAHEVTLTYDYYIGQTEVTQALWKAVMGYNPSTIIGDNLPVNKVLWGEAQAFVYKLNQITGLSFDLPTEAEWEYAARGGKKSKGYLYAGSNNLDEVAWYNSNSGGVTHPVAQKMPNELGIYDMSGNVWEWCSDWLAPYTAEAQLNPTGPATGECHVYHGGGWTYGQNFCRSSHRRQTVSGYVQQALGLRVVLREKVEPEYVDLGLSVKWATFNVGATSPEDYGDYFAWGETETKDKYSWATYKWCQGTANTLTKYCSNGQYGNADYKTILDPEDDAAIVHWGSDWRMPTIDEWLELKQKCSWKKIIINGITGYQVTAKNGNSIFLPRAGLRMSDILYANDSVGYYASSSHLPEFSHEDYASYMLMYDNSISKSSTVRYYGLSIRPVYDDRVTLTVIPTLEDAKVSFHCSGYQWAGNSITVDKGKDVLYQVTNVDAGYLSQGDSIYKLTKDSVLYVTLRPFSDGNWVVVDNSEYTKQEGYYVSRNNGGFASHSVWNYYVLPVLPGETYRVRGIAGQHAALWMAASTAPDAATNTRPTKISCCANRGVAAYVADEVTIPDGAKYLIINSRNGKEMMVERQVPDPCLVVKVNDTLSINMMCVEGGTFMMGAMDNDEKAKDDEKPAHKVTLTYDYHIMQTEVTQGLWEAVMGEDIYVAQTNMENAPKPAYVGGDYPMYYVRMNDALEFIDKLNAMTGMHFRLPTEAEWEYAARGGNKSKGYLYAGSNNADDVGWYTGRGGLHRVAQLKPNELGIYDMSGNVSEMCLDYGTYGETYKAGDVVNPRGNIRSNGNRFWRGGSYTHSKDSMRVSQRSSYTPSWGGTWLGLRLVLAEDNDFRTIRVSNSYFDMSFVKGGTFMMGSDAPDAQADEQPVHEVTLSDYYIGQTEVTQHLWKKVMGDENNPSATKGNYLPITNITWNEAQTFVERLSELTGMRFRLPTEAEWEYAARGGRKSKGYTYAGSDDIDEVAWYASNSDNKTHSVGQKLPNELGMYDMTGNVWEWCHDWHMPYSAQAQTNPTGAATGEKPVLRGGCYHYDSKNCTNTNRHSYYTPDKGGASTGLRIVLESQRYYRYGYTQEDWDAATDSWGHQGRGHAPADQSCIQGTMVRGIRLKVASAGSLNVYKVPSLLEKNEDHFELVATLTTTTTGVQDFDFTEPIYIAPNEYLVFGKPSEKMPTLRPYYANHLGDTFPIKAKALAHYVGTDKAKVSTSKSSLMVEFY